MYHILRWFFAIAILVIVFSVGVQIGRLSSALENGGYMGSSYRHMQYYGYSNEVPPMMYSGSANTNMMRFANPTDGTPTTAAKK